jgi:hypothetical protein
MRICISTTALSTPIHHYLRLCVGATAWMHRPHVAESEMGCLGIGTHYRPPIVYSKRVYGRRRRQCAHLMDTLYSVFANTHVMHIGLWGLGYLLPYSCWLAHIHSRADDASLSCCALCLFYKLSESHDHRRDTNLTMNDVTAVCGIVECCYQLRGIIIFFQA